MCDTKTTSTEALRDEFYDRLIDEHNFQKSERWRTPGTTDAVTKDNAEITTVPSGSFGLRVDIHIPVDAREDRNFRRESCGGITYLGQRETIVLKQRKDIAEKIDRVVDLATRGSGVLQLCGLEPHPYIN